LSTVPAVVNQKFHRRFVRTLNSTCCEPAIKTDITVGCPFNPEVVNGLEENLISLLFFFTHSTSSPAASPTIFVDRLLMKAVNFQRML
jgi:hypothetical protein